MSLTKSHSPRSHTASTISVRARSVIRPRPERSFKDRTYAIAMSPDSIESAIDLGRGGLDFFKLINDLIDLSRIEAGRLKVEIASVELAPLFGEFLVRHWGFSALFAFSTLLAMAATPAFLYRMAIGPLGPSCLDSKAGRGCRGCRGPDREHTWTSR